MTSVISTSHAVPPAARASVPIAEYGMLADCASAALVTRDGSIDWLCLPRYDSPAIFARLLDPDAGHWSIRPRGEFTVERRYLPGTLVIETTFITPSGRVRLTDALAFAEGQRGHDIGLEAPHELLRRVEGVEGEVDMVMELAPRPEYGLVKPLFRQTEGGGRTFGGPNQVAVRAGVPVARRGRRHDRRVQRRRRRGGGLLARLGRRRGRRAGGVPAGARRRAAGRHGRGVELVGARARHLRGPAPRARALLLARAQGPDLPARRARSSPRRRPRCPRPSAASATGTTASRGSATRA